MKKQQRFFIIAFVVIIGGFLIMPKTARGIRNNNPGNIRRSADDWKGLAPEQNDSSFFQFVKPVYGIRALVKILRNYQNLYHLDTVDEIINRYAPSFENQTASYVKHVSLSLGVQPDDKLNLNDETIMFNLVSAIIRHENGSNPYDVVTTFEAIRMV